MAVTIRLRRTGTTQATGYRVVVADSRSPRDGRFIEMLGHYNPVTEPPTVSDRPGEGGGVDQEGRPALEHGAEADRDASERRPRQPDRGDAGDATSVVDRRVTRPHGLRGEVRVTPLTDRRSDSSGLARVRAVGPGARRRATLRRITAARRQGGAVLLSLAGCDAVEAAERARRPAGGAARGRGAAAAARPLLPVAARAAAACSTEDGRGRRRVSAHRAGAGAGSLGGATGAGAST